MKRVRILPSIILTKQEVIFVVYCMSKDVKYDTAKPPLTHITLNTCTSCHAISQEVMIPVNFEGSTEIYT